MIVSIDSLRCHEPSRAISGSIHTTNEMKKVKNGVKGGYDCGCGGEVGKDRGSERNNKRNSNEEKERMRE